METNTLSDRQLLKVILESESIDVIRETARINLDIIQAIRVYTEKNCPVEIFLKYLADGDIEGAFHATKDGERKYLKKPLKPDESSKKLHRLILVNRSLRKKAGKIFSGRKSSTPGSDNNKRMNNLDSQLEKLLLMNRELTYKLQKKLEE